MVKTLLLISLLFSSVVFSQKDTAEVIDASEIQNIQIETDEVYLIRIISTNTSHIKIRTHSEGEYFNRIIVNSEIAGNILTISTQYPEELRGGYDKLSAHKVFSLEIEMEVPSGLQVNVQSNIASLHCSGKFESIFAELKQGYCKLLEFTGSAVVNTFSGYIHVETSTGMIEASSRNGRVDIPEFLPGRNPLKLASIDGNIMVRKTK
ncbi:hypothetical protein [Christiangramia sabulilitoris]|uniref:DUF4097 domain-containing protein n=1 Tax=Christiangramia sabulilitoris TaxID=2583991 RepID=A0A550I8H6_9FLAO|nr:hypothetical protein [Christiangramia sabulilitoris]TRO67270.1 hypothetical protein FGM01_05145 [Christiangramia sabulilitoris]